MKPAPFRYERPTNLAEALAVRAAEPEAKVLAGGQSLIPLMSMRLSTVPVLIDINGLEELSHITVDDSGVRFGAIVRHSALLAHDGAARVQPLIAAALQHVAHATIRNRGTSVGSIVHADASGEMPMILCLTGGSLTVASTRGRREIPAADLFVGAMETSLEPDEIAVEAFMPALPARSGIAYDEVARRHGDYALCGVGAVVTHDEEGRIEHARAGFVSVSDVPEVVDLTECFPGGELDEGSLAAAGEHALERLDPEPDIHATADYRALLARTLTARVLRAADEDARARTMQKGRA
ncbi:FAD binding domain-containing protein [Janibacter corallicola]|uniref:FAD binding domain-containing protein n=1 Tax=Janibacter corallicola TaxID=415212 RepID=UPI0008302504|nr:FAD binding domain-containing protein [Janibacter corallicola]